MSISNLSIDDKKRLSDLHNKLHDIVSSRSSIDNIIFPLFEKYNKLTEEEKKLDSLYDDLDLNSDDIGLGEDSSEKLCEVVSRIEEIAEEKKKLEDEILNTNSKYDEIKSKEIEILSQIDLIKTSGTKSETETKENIANLDKNVSLQNEIIIKNKDILKDMDMDNLKAKKIKNSIIKTKRSVSNYIKTVFQDSQELKVVVSGVGEKLLGVTNSTINVKQDSIISTNDEKNAIQDIIDRYNKTKEIKSQIEDAADNLLMGDEAINESIYINQNSENETKIEHEVEDNIIDNKFNEDEVIVEKPPLVSEDESKVIDIPLSLEDNVTNDNIENNNEDVEVNNSQLNNEQPNNNIASYGDTVQSVNLAKNKIARSNKNKIWGIQELFKPYLNQKTNNISYNESIKQNYNSEDNIVDIFGQTDTMKLVS